jgi:hypothetical protein
MASTISIPEHVNDASDVKEGIKPNVSSFALDSSDTNEKTTTNRARWEYAKFCFTKEGLFGDYVSISCRRQPSI